MGGNILSIRWHVGFLEVSIDTGIGQALQKSALYLLRNIEILVGQSFSNFQYLIKITERSESTRWYYYPFYSKKKIKRGVSSPRYITAKVFRFQNARQSIPILVLNAQGQSLAGLHFLRFKRVYTCREQQNNLIETMHLSSSEKKRSNTHV